MLVTTQTANKLIADVWFARADFAKDHPDKIEALVRGIFDAMEELKKRDQESQVRQADGRWLQHSGHRNHQDVRRRPQHQLGRELSVLPEPEQSDELRARLDAGVLPVSPHRRDHASAGAVRQGDGLLRHRETRQGTEVLLAEGRVSGPPRAEDRCRYPAESDEILTNTVVIQFFPNSWDLYKKINRDENGTKTEVLYDPNVDIVLEEVAKLAGQFGAARIIIEGHTDGSRRGQVPEAW